MGKALLAIIFSICLIFLLVSTVNVLAGPQAGVGVLNVAPQFNSVRLLQQDDVVRLYLTVTDYNSWDDIYEVVISLDDNGLETASFTFKQYQDTTSFEKILQFSETSKENNLLKKEICSYSYSDKKESVEDRCNLNLLFVFSTTWFTRISIYVYDREGATATNQIDYNAEDMMRSGDMIVIPWIDGPLPLEISSAILDGFAITAGVAGSVYIAKKKRIIGVVR